MATGAFVRRDGITQPHAQRYTSVRRKGGVQDGAGNDLQFVDVGDDEVHGYVRPGEDVWYIVRARPRVARHGDDTPGSGTLLLTAGDDTPVPALLAHTDVRADITAFVATVDVRQQFRNPLAANVDAVYVFPLPHDASVTGFVMQIGERRIRGIVREREEAERLYQAARDQGFNAALLTEERPNVFTQRVANIEPNRPIDVHIRYFHALSAADGWFQWHFPMVVGPRYNPPGTVAPVDVAYERRDHHARSDINIAVALTPGIRIEQLESPSHTIVHGSLAASHVQVGLADAAHVANQDFVLRWRVAGNAIKATALVEPEQDGGRFAVMLQPPAALAGMDRNAAEFVFVFDVSGSMTGEPLATSKAAVRRALQLLRADDTFQIVTFADRAKVRSARPLTASRANVRRALADVDALQAGGGTEMLTGIDAAFGPPSVDGRERVVVLLTDGYIGNEDEVFAAVAERIARHFGRERPPRLFSFGIGGSVNRHMLEGLARFGRGAVAYVGPGDDGGEIMEYAYTRMTRPALTDLELDFAGREVTDTFPARLPDLFIGRPVLAFGRFSGSVPSHVRVLGTLDGRRVALDVPLVQAPLPSPFVGDATMGPLTALWARARIGALTDARVVDGDVAGVYRQEILDTALRYGLVSAYTAFVAVDASRRTSGFQGFRAPMPVPMPAGVSFDATVERP